MPARSVLTAPQSAGPAPTGVDAIRRPVTADLEAVDRLIRRRLFSQVSLVNQVASHIINSGGKRLRPLLVLLGARAAGYQGESHVSLAAVTEFIHTATLLHDDVVDASSLRRGQDTANALWGNDASVLVGDFLYSRAFQMLVEIGSVRIMDIFADATNVIAEGEVMQLLNCHRPETSEEEYLAVIRAKTAKLFEAAARVGAVLGERCGEVEEALRAYGRHVGTAYQLVDDVLDYRGSPTEIGKNVGDDLGEGKPTLPLIHALRHAGAAERALIRDAIVHGGRERIAGVVQAVESCGAIAYTSRLARREADQALDALAVLPSSEYKDALRRLAAFSVERFY